MLSSQFDGFEKKADSLLNKRIEIQKLDDSNNTNFTTKFIGFVVVHKFRAGNKMGGVILTNWYFKFNTDVTIITEVITNE